MDGRTLFDWQTNLQDAVRVLGGDILFSDRLREPEATVVRPSLAAALVLSFRRDVQDAVVPAYTDLLGVVPGISTLRTNVSSYNS